MAQIVILKKEIIVLKEDNSNLLAKIAELEAEIET